MDEEGVGFVDLADHLVDFWDVQVGGENAELWIKDAGPSRFYDENFQAQWVRKIRPHTKKPIAGVGRFTSPDTMVDVITSGQLDIIGAARPSISDPFLPKKIEEGRFDDIRECIGCNVCVSRVNARWHLICTQNSTAGEEYRRGWHPERMPQARAKDKSVLIIGAGPAGLECAVVLGKRGYENVHLVDANDEIGGHAGWVSTLPGMHAWRRVIDWRRAQLDKLPVQVITARKMTAAEAVDYGAENIIVATGAFWAGTGINGITHHPVTGADPALPAVATPEQLIRDGKKLPGQRVVIFDAEGYFMGVSLAQKLQQDGHQVRLITNFAVPAPYFTFTGENVHMRPLLASLGVDVVTEHVVTSFDSGVVGGFSTVTEGPAKWEADAIVAVSQRVPNGALFEEIEVLLEDSGEDIRLFRIGDCVSPRMLMADAIFDGARLAREFDDENPWEPRPWIRERRLIGATDETYDAVLAVRND